jgi:predicted GNAT family acetyltransferase
LRPANLIPAPSVSAHGLWEPRRAAETDIERLIDFYIRGFYSLAYLPSRAAWHSRLVEQLRYRTLFLIEDAQGQVASAAMSSAESAGGAMLGGVATLPEYEGRGLSTLCVGALCTDLFDRGMPLISLFFLKENVQAARVYEKLGFEPDGEWLLASLGGF